MSRWFILLHTRLLRVWLVYRPTSLVRSPPFPTRGELLPLPYQVVASNLKMDLHTLALLDIQAHHDYYMTANQGLEYLLKVAQDRGDQLLNEDSLAVVVARAVTLNPGQADQMGKLVKETWGPLHCLIIPGSCTSWRPRHWWCWVGLQGDPG